MTAATITTLDTSTGELTAVPAPPSGLPTSSPTIGKIAGALAKAQGAMRHALKEADNTHFKSKYADLASVIDAARPALSENGIAVVQRDLPTEAPGVIVQTVLLHESGEWIADEGVYVPASKLDAHGYGSARTYARRYGLASVVGVAQEDDDGNAAAKSAPKNATRAPEPLTKEQADALVAKLVEGGMSKATATANAKKVTPASFDKAMTKAQQLVDERAEAAASTETCATCAGTGQAADDSACNVCAGMGEVAA